MLLCRKNTRFVIYCRKDRHRKIRVIYLSRGDILAYYLLISFVVFLIIDYHYIYSFIDSRFLYNSTGSKLKLETKGYKNKRFQSINKTAVYITLFLFLLMFSINFTISSLAFSTNPLLVNISISVINLQELINTKLVIIYHTSCALAILFIIFSNLDKIEKCLLRILNKNIVIKNEIHNKDTSYVIAKTVNDECFEVSKEALYQNVLITGSIGSGKTSGAISRFAHNLIKSGQGGLILDVKGNFVNTVENICKLHGRTNDLQVISKKSNYFFEIMDNNISSLELANRFKMVITLLSQNNNSDSYWLDKVENVIMNFIILMKYAKKLNLITLHKMVSDDVYLKNMLLKIKEKIKRDVPEDRKAHELTFAISFVENEYFKLDSRVSNIIKSEITRLTIPLVTDYDIYNQFCEQGNKEEIDFSSNKIIVLSINIGSDKVIAKIIATFLKLSFQKYILSNISKPEPHFFIADEFQEFCNAEDAHFLSLSREAKCINIISTQSYSSIKSTIKDANATNVIIQNLVNKIWFRNDDNYTISEIIKQLGKTNVMKENKTISESGQESKKYFFKEGFKNKKSSISKSLNLVCVKENEYDENFFSRELKTFEALAFVIADKGIITEKIMFERWK